MFACVRVDVRWVHDVSARRRQMQEEWAHSLDRDVPDGDPSRERGFFFLVSYEDFLE